MSWGGFWEDLTGAAEDVFDTAVDITTNVITAPVRIVKNTGEYLDKVFSGENILDATTQYAAKTYVNTLIPAINADGFVDDLKEWWDDPSYKLFHDSLGMMPSKAEQKKDIEKVTFNGATFEEVREFWKDKDQLNPEAWQTYADKFFDGNIDQAIGRSTMAQVLGVYDEKAIENMQARIDSYKKNFKGRSKTLNTLESATGLYKGTDPKELTSYTDAVKWQEQSKERYKNVTEKILGKEIINLDKGGFNKLEDFARNNKTNDLKEGMNKIRNRLEGSENRDTGEQARQYLVNSIKQSNNASVKMDPSQSSSMSRLASNATALNNRQQVVNQYYDKIKAREELANMSSRLLQYDTERKKDLRSLKGSFITATAGLEAGEVGFEELWGLNNSPLKY